MRFCERCRAAFQSLRTCPRDNIATRADLSDPLIGQVLGDRYRVLDRIAAGGMGQVYRAAHVRIASLFAVKVLYGDVAHDPEMRLRFQREAEASSCLSSRYIVRVVDFGETPEGLSYLVMEYVDGPSLGGVLERHPRLPEERAVVIAGQVARGLAHAHQRGIVHRDLKPDNVIMVDDDEDEPVAKLLDFGLAYIRTESRLTVAGQVFGTPQYMSPEQFRGDPADARTDLYALGVMLFEMVAGAPPFEGRTVAELARQHIVTPPQRIRDRCPEAGASAGLEAAVARLMAKSPDDRFPSARALLEALRALGQGAPASRAAPAPASRRARALPDAVRERIEAAIRDGAPRYNAGDHAGCLALYWRASEELLAGAFAGGGAAAARLRTALVRASRAETPSDGAWEVRYAFDDLLHATAAVRPAEGPGGRLTMEIALAEIVSAPRYAAGHVDLVGDYYLELTRQLAQALRGEGLAAKAAELEQVAAAAARLGGGQRALAYLRESLDRLRAGDALTSASAPLASGVLEDCPVLDDVAQRIVHALAIGVPAYNAGDVGGCYRVYRQAAVAIVAELGSAPACAPVSARLREALDDTNGLADDKAAWALRHAFDDLLAAAARKRQPRGTLR